MADEKKDVKQEKDSKATEQARVESDDYSELDELKSQMKADDAKFAKEDAEATDDDKSEDSADDDADGEVTEDDKKAEQQNEQQKKDSEDSIDAELLNDVFGKKKDQRDSKQSENNEIAELRRKVEKLTKKQEENVEAGQPPPSQMSKEDLEKAFETDYPDGFSGKQAVAVMQFLDDHYQTRVLPAWKREQEADRIKSGYKDRIKEHKYYPFVKDEVGRLVREDPRISQLPEDQKWDSAMDKALAGAVPELLKRQAKKTEKLTKEGKKLILRDQPAADKLVKRDKSAVVLSREDKSFQSQMSLSDKDMDNKLYDEGKTVIED